MAALPEKKKSTPLPEGDLLEIQTYGTGNNYRHAVAGTTTGVFYAIEVIEEGATITELLGENAQDDMAAHHNIKSVALTKGEVYRAATKYTSITTSTANAINLIR
jgi:hypothetical protein